MYCLHWKLLNAKIYCLPFRRDQLQVMKMQSVSVNYNSLLRMRRRLNFEIVWKAIKKTNKKTIETIKNPPKTNKNNSNCLHTFKH